MHISKESHIPGHGAAAGGHLFLRCGHAGDHGPTRPHLAERPHCPPSVLDAGHRSFEPSCSPDECAAAPAVAKDVCAEDVRRLEAEALRLMNLKAWASLQLDATVRSLRVAEEALAAASSSADRRSDHSDLPVLYHIPPVGRPPLLPRAGDPRGPLSQSMTSASAATAAWACGSPPQVVRTIPAFTTNGRVVDFIA